jgi:hypothetical protein
MEMKGKKAAGIVVLACSELAKYPLIEKQQNT